MSIDRDRYLVFSINNHFPQEISQIRSQKMLSDTYGWSCIPEMPVFYILLETISVFDNY